MRCVRVRSVHLHRIKILITRTKIFFGRDHKVVCICSTHHYKYETVSFYDFYFSVKYETIRQSQRFRQYIIYNKYTYILRQIHQKSYRQICCTICKSYTYYIYAIRILLHNYIYKYIEISAENTKLGYRNRILRKWKIIIEALFRFQGKLFQYTLHTVHTLTHRYSIQIQIVVFTEQMNTTLEDAHCTTA